MTLDLSLQQALKIFLNTLFHATDNDLRVKAVKKPLMVFNNKLVIHPLESVQDLSTETNHSVTISLVTFVRLHHNTIKYHCIFFV